MQINFLNGSSSGRSTAVDSQVSMNLYPEIKGAESKGQVILIGTPGLEYLTKGAAGAVRSMITTGSDRLFAVIGADFVEVKSDYTLTYIALLQTASGFVTMVENVNTTDQTTQIMITDGVNGYVYKQREGTFTIITDANYLSGTHVVWYNGYYVQNVTNENKFIFSDLYDGLTWNARYYALEGNPDNCSAVATINNELWAFGQKSLEVWATTGDLSDPFQRINNAYVNIGLKSTRSLVALNNQLIWLGANSQGENVVWMASNYIPQRISTNAEEYIISQISDPENCKAYSYQQEGHLFYVMNFTSANKTLVYDVTTGMWHNRSYYDTTNGEHKAHRGATSAHWNGNVVIGDYGLPNIYKYNLDYYYDNGGTIVRYRQGPHIHDDMKRLFFNSFEIDLEKGVGSEAGSDPQIMLQFSDDGGYSWSRELWQSMGKIGERLVRVIWHRLGMARDRVFRVTISDPVKVILIGASADISKEG